MEQSEEYLKESKREPASVWIELVCFVFVVR